MGRTNQAFYPVGSGDLSVDIGLVARSIIVDNPTNQYLHILGSTDSFIKPYTMQAVKALTVSTKVAQARYEAPVGITGVKSIPGQGATLTYVEEILPEAPGDTLPSALSQPITTHLPPGATLLGTVTVPNTRAFLVPTGTTAIGLHPTSASGVTVSSGGVLLNPTGLQPANKISWVPWPLSGFSAQVTPSGVSGVDSVDVYAFTGPTTSVILVPNDEPSLQISPRPCDFKGSALAAAGVIATVTITGVVGKKFTVQRFHYGLTQTGNPGAAGATTSASILDGAAFVDNRTVGVGVTNGLNYIADGTSTGLQGSTNTNMVIAFAAALANVSQSVGIGVYSD